MKKLINSKILMFIVAIFALTLMSNSACDTSETTTNSGVQKAEVFINTDADGNTIEQKQIAERVRNDNKPGAIKHLYVISPYSGDVILYSTVYGKVTSSGKRLQPKMVHGGLDGGSTSDYNYVVIGNKKFTTDEVIQDDGTFGDSDPYIYWYDVRGVYHQHFMTGGQIIHVSDQPLNVKSVIINVEQLSGDEK